MHQPQLALRILDELCKHNTRPTKFAYNILIKQIATYPTSSTTKWNIKELPRIINFKQFVKKELKIEEKKYVISGKTELFKKYFNFDSGIFS